jgi:hypothetical protein
LSARLADGCTRVSTGRSSVHCGLSFCTEGGGLRKAVFFRRQRVFSPLAVEYPLVYHAQYAATWQYGDAFETGMAVSVESYIGAEVVARASSSNSACSLAKSGDSAAMRIPIRDGTHRLKSFI